VGRRKRIVSGSPELVDYLAARGGILTVALRDIMVG